MLLHDIFAILEHFPIHFLLFLSLLNFLWRFPVDWADSSISEHVFHFTCLSTHSSFVTRLINDKQMCFSIVQCKLIRSHFFSICRLIFHIIVHESNKLHQIEAIRLTMEVKLFWNIIFFFKAKSEDVQYQGKFIVFFF